MIVDTHCHLHHKAFADVREALRTALTHDVWGVIAVGCDPETNAWTLTASTAAPKAVWAALGYHPEWIHLGDTHLEQVEQQVRDHQSRIVALGEVGLPWYSLQRDSDAAGRMARGRQRLSRLLALAARYDLPVSLHAPHGAAAVALETLREHGIERAAFHWHKATADVTQAIVDAGYLISVTPEVVYRERDRQLVAALPLEALVVESDAPWRYEGEFEGLPSGPWLAGRVVEEVAKIKQIPVDDVMFQLSANACRLFDLVWT
jgi:TatD DNase family protein